MQGSAKDRESIKWGFGLVTDFTKGVWIDKIKNRNEESQETKEGKYPRIKNWGPKVLATIWNVCFNCWKERNNDVARARCKVAANRIQNWVNTGEVNEEDRWFINNKGFHNPSEQSISNIIKSWDQIKGRYKKTITTNRLAQCTLVDLWR